MAYQRRAARYHDHRVKERILKAEYLVLRKLDVTDKREGQGKLAPTWEGPFKIIKVIRPTVFHLKDLNGKREPHAWNV